MAWNPFRDNYNKPASEPYYEVQVHCTNCGFGNNSVELIHIPVGKNVHDYMRDTSATCPNCKCSGTLVQS